MAEMNSPVSPQHLQLMAPATQIARDRAQRRHEAMMMGNQHKQNKEMLNQRLSSDEHMARLNHELSKRGIAFNAKTQYELDASKQKLAEEAQLRQMRREQRLRNIANGVGRDLTYKDYHDDVSIMRRRFRDQQLENLLKNTLMDRGQDVTGATPGPAVGGMPPTAGPGAAGPMPTEGTGMMLPGSPGVMDPFDGLMEAVLHPMYKRMGSTTVDLVTEEQNQQAIARSIMSKTMARAGMQSPTFNEDGTVATSGAVPTGGPVDQPGGIGGYFNFIWDNATDVIWPIKEDGLWSAAFSGVTGDQQALIDYQQKKTQMALGIIGKDTSAYDQGRQYVSQLYGTQLKQSFQEEISKASRDAGIDVEVAMNEFNVLWAMLDKVIEGEKQAPIGYGSMLDESGVNLPTDIRSTDNLNSPEVEELRAYLKEKHEMDGDRQSKAATQLVLSTIGSFFGDSENGSGFLMMADQFNKARQMGDTDIDDNTINWITGINDGLSDAGMMIQHAIDPYVLTLSERRAAQAALQELSDDWDPNLQQRLIQLRASGGDLSAFIEEQKGATARRVKKFFDSLPPEMKSDEMLERVQTEIGDYDSLMPSFEEWAAEAEAARSAGEPFALPPEQLRNTMVGRDLISAWTKHAMMVEQEREMDFEVERSKEEQEMLEQLDQDLLNEIEEMM